MYIPWNLLGSTDRFSGSHSIGIEHNFIDKETLECIATGQLDLAEEEFNFLSALLSGFRLGFQIGSGIWTHSVPINPWRDVLCALCNQNQDEFDILHSSVAALLSEFRLGFQIGSGIWAHSVLNTSRGYSDFPPKWSFIMAEIGTLFGQGDPGDHFSGRSFQRSFWVYFFSRAFGVRRSFWWAIISAIISNGKVFQNPATIILAII